MKIGTHAQVKDSRSIKLSVQKKLVGSVNMYDDVKNTLLAHIDIQINRLMQCNLRDRASFENMLFGEKDVKRLVAATNEQNNCSKSN